MAEFSFQILLASESNVAEKHRMPGLYADYFSERIGICIINGKETNQCDT